MPTRNVSQVLWVAKAAANSGASVETEPSISPTRPGCTYCSRNIRRAVSSSFSRAFLVRICSPSCLRHVLVFVLDLGQFVEQLADRGVARGFRRLAVEAAGLVFHRLGVFAHFVEVERAHQPDRRLLDEAFDVLAADQRQVVAEFFPIEVEQHGAMAHFLVRHLVEYLGGGRKLRAQTLGESAIDAAVLFFVGDGEGEDFLLGTGRKIASRRPLFELG